jgi:periplasmic protein TonB
MSDLGNLSQCMVDSDADANGRARRLRGKALVASLVLEAVVLAGIVLWPLVTLGVLPPQLMITPVPPFRGVQDSRPTPPHQVHRRNMPQASRMVDLVQQPPKIPRRIASNPDPEPPGILGQADRPGLPNSGDSIIGGNENGPAVEVMRPAPESKPQKISSGVMDASLIRRVQPEYPKLATLMRLSGTVVLRATIGKDGEVREAEVVSGNPILAQAAMKAVKEWRYRPTLLSGEPVEVETEITVNFILQ